MITETHKGITISIGKRQLVSRGCHYTAWEIRERKGTKLIRHRRSTLEEARAKARDIAEALSADKKEVIGWAWTRTTVT